MSLYREIVEIGAIVGSLGALGGVIGFLCTAAARSLPRAVAASYGEWVTYGAGLAGTLAFAYELFERAGL